MAFTLQTFATASDSANTDAPRLFTYISAADALATIIASAYFNDVAKHLQINDFIWVVGTDGASVYKVTAVTPNVTVVLFATLGDGTVTTAKLADSAITTAKIDALAVTTAKIALLAVDAAQLAALAVTTAKIAANAVTLAKLATGITPSHVEKFAGKFVNAGGSATITITGLTGMDATNYIGFANLQSSANAVTVQKVTPGVDQMVVLLSADPGACVLSYHALLAAA